MTQRIRNTVATRRHAQNIKDLVVALASCEMGFDEICDLLTLSPSGARKYMRELSDDGVIEIARHVNQTKSNPPGRPIYGLALDAEATTAYVAKLICEPVGAIVERTPRVIPDIACLHTCGNDGMGPRRVHSRFIGKHDQLHEVFFGRVVAA